MEGQRLNLERSLLYYRLGRDQGVEIKQGYASINAAYLLELLANQEASEKLDDKRLAALVPAAHTAPTANADTAALRRVEADNIRRQIIDKVCPLVNDRPEITTGGR